MSYSPEQSNPDIPAPTIDLQLHNLYYHCDVLIEALYDQEPDSAVYHFTFAGPGVGHTILPEVIQSELETGSSLHDINLTIIQDQTDDLCTVAVGFGLFSDLGKRTELDFTFPCDPDMAIDGAMTVDELSGLLFSMVYVKEEVEAKRALLSNEDVRSVVMLNMLIPHLKSYAYQYEASVDYQLPMANDDAIDVRFENTFEYPDTTVVGVNISQTNLSEYDEVRVAVAVDPERHNPVEYSLSSCGKNQGIEIVDSTHPLAIRLLTSIRGAIQYTFSHDAYIVSADTLKEVVDG